MMIDARPWLESPDKSLSLIVAADQDGLIGRKGDLPWRLPNDLAHFKRITMGKTILMGRKTWDSLGRALPGRNNWVISGNAALKAEGASVFSSLEQALVAHGVGELMVIGGAQLYAQTLPLARRIYLTQVLTRLAPGASDDVHFPQFDPAAFVQSSCDEHAADERHAWAYRFLVLDRK